MRQYSEEEIEALLLVQGGDIEDKAAAMAVVTAAIRESRRLGRIALGTPKSSWHGGNSALRDGMATNWRSSARPSL